MLETETLGPCLVLKLKREPHGPPWPHNDYAPVMKSILNIVLWKYISDGNCYYFTLLVNENSSTATTLALEILLSTTEQNLAGMRIMVIMTLELAM